MVVKDHNLKEGVYLICAEPKTFPTNATKYNLNIVKTKMKISKEIKWENLVRVKEGNGSISFLGFFWFFLFFS